MKNNLLKRAIALLLALVCVMGILPLSAFAKGLSTAPKSITQKSCNYMFNGGSPVRYKAANSTVNSYGIPYVFDVQMNVPGYGTARGLCAYQVGTLGGRANGQRWNFQKEITHPSLKLMLTYIYGYTYGEFTEAGKAAAMEPWGAMWSDMWFVVAQALTWCNEHGVLIDYSADKEGFIKQAAKEMLAAFKMFDAVWNSSPWIKDWSKVDIYTIIDSRDGGLTGASAYDYIATAVRIMLEHSEYFYNYHLWQYQWDKSQPWKLTGQEGTPMQHLLIAIPEGGTNELPVSLTVKKLEAGTDKPIPGVTFKIESADGSGDFSVTRETGEDGTFTLTTKADKLTAGQYKITETAVPEGYKMLTSSQLVTVMPGNSADSTFIFYNEEEITGEGTIRKVDADNPTVGIPGAVIKITSVKLDDGGSFTGTYTTGEGGYISKEDLDFSKLPKGSYTAEEITPPEGYILSSNTSKVKQTFVWDGKTDVMILSISVDTFNSKICGTYAAASRAA